jgi:micrococcal nuclease
MPAQVCARCHAPRTGAFRYCRECGYDFDAESMDAAGAAARAKARAKAQAAMRQAKKRGTADGDGRTRRYVVRGLIVFEVIALTALAGYGILTNVTGGPDIAAVFATPRPTPTATPTPAVTLPATGFVPSGPTSEATVERVVDGDTIVVDADGVELYVRYIGMDAPEAVKLDTPVQFMAPEATQANAQLVSGQTVILERDVSEADDSARLLRHVWVDRDGTLFLVGLELVKAGFAQATPVPPDTKYEALYADAEAAAKAAGLGIWGAPPSPEPDGSGAPATPAPSLPTFTSLAPVSIIAERTYFRGGIGIYDWTSVSFPTSTVTMAWDIRSTTRSGCRVDWAIQARGVEPAAGAQELDGRTRKEGSGRVTVPAGATRVTITSTCGDWLISLREAG